ncbi:hypothetical protein CRUP_015966 [Coryphaenoides rupestris]|nr:hypothetical protein CRUP_015966 [Coryphaenoides rupestris]
MNKRERETPRAREAWSHCRSLLPPDPSPLDTSGPLRSLVALLSLQAQPRPLAPALVLGVLVNAAVLSTEPVGRAAEVLRAVVHRCGLATEALCVLSSVELGLAGGDGNMRSPSDASSSSSSSRGQLRRTRALRDALTQDTATETC